MTSKVYTNNIQKVHPFRVDFFVFFLFFPLYSLTFLSVLLTIMIL